MPPSRAKRTAPRRAFLSDREASRTSSGRSRRGQRGGQFQRLQGREQALARARFGDAQALAQLGLRHHAQRDREPVVDAVAAGTLDGMTDRVAKVERGPRTGLGRVQRDKARLDPDRTYTSDVRTDASAPVRADALSTIQSK